MATPKQVLNLVNESLMDRFKREAPVRSNDALIFPASSLGKCPLAILAETAQVEPPVKPSIDMLGYAMLGNAIHRYVQEALTSSGRIKIEAERRFVDPEERLAATIDLFAETSSGPLIIEIKTVSKVLKRIPSYWMLQMGAQRIVVPGSQVFLLQISRQDGTLDIQAPRLDTAVSEVRSIVKYLVECIRDGVLPKPENPSCEYCNYYPCSALDWGVILEVLNSRLEGD